MTELKMKVDSERIEWENLRNKNQTEIIYLIRMKDQLVSEIEELKWKVSRSDELNSSSNKKIASLNERVLKISEELINEQERTTSNREVIKELENKIEAKCEQILAKEAK